MTELQQNITGSLPGRIHHWIRLLCLAVLAAGCVSSRAASFTASLDHEKVLLGDTATLSLRFDGGSPSEGVQLPEVPGLQYLNANNPNINRVSVNGQLTLIVGIVVKPTEAGEVTIPPLQAKVGNETLASQPIKFTVVRPAPPEPGSEAEAQSLALLRAVLPKKQVYVGEAFVLQMQLLVRSGVQRVVDNNLPGVQAPLQISGCAVGRAVQRENRQTVIGNTPFTLIPLEIPITVMKPGALRIGPLEGAVVLELPGRRRQDDIFEQFGFGGFGGFNRGPQQRVAVSSPEVTLTALPLPEQAKPASFAGAVGQFKMDFQVGLTNVAVGDPVTLRITIDGQGALDSITLPDQPAWKEFKVYPPTIKIETRDEFELNGAKTFEQVVVPENTEIKELPPFEFSYFDPEKGRYETLREAAHPLIVRPSGSTPAPTLAANTAKSETPASAQDIVHIKPRLGRAVTRTEPLVKQTWFLALQGVPVFALIGAIFWRRRCDSLANNPRLRRQRQVESVVRDGLAQLRQLASERKSDEFFAQVFRLIQERVGERLDMPASAITEAVVDDKLRARGLGSEAAGALHELFQQCNQARYAPVQSPQELEAVIPKLEAALAQVREVRA